MSYSPDARRLALNAYRSAGWSLAQGARHLGVSRATLTEWLRRDERGESLEDRPRSGRTPLFGDEHKARLLELAREHPDWTQQRYADALNAEFEGLGVSQPQICTALKRAGVSFKKKSGAPTRRAASASPSVPASS